MNFSNTVGLSDDLMEQGVIAMYPFRTYGTKRVNLLRETFG